MRPGMLVDVPRLVTTYYFVVPDAAVPAQRVAFGTSGHRGSPLRVAFNEAHILATTQAICLYRGQQEITGPLFLGIDTHALSIPAYATVLDVLAANGVEVTIAEGDEYTPTPVISHAILAYNRGRKVGIAAEVLVRATLKVAARPTADSVWPVTLEPVDSAAVAVWRNEGDPN
jgi:phosphoglucomutase